MSNTHDRIVECPRRPLRGTLVVYGEEVAPAICPPLRKEARYVDTLVVVLLVLILLAVTGHLHL